MAEDTKPKGEQTTNVEFIAGNDGFGTDETPIIGGRNYKNIMNERTGRGPWPGNKRIDEVYPSTGKKTR